MTVAIHGHLPCGMEYAVLPLPARHVVSFQIRVLSGLCSEPPDKLGLGRLVEETLDKGTEHRTGPELSDAFDRIGASRRSGTGRETTTFTCTVLPEHFEAAVALHAEFLRTPTFPDEAYQVGISLTRQELLALEDDAQGLADRRLCAAAYGPVLGRHPLGLPATIAKITRQDLVDHWRRNFHAGRMVVTTAGAIEAGRAAEILEKAFAGFGDARKNGRQKLPVEFRPGFIHDFKELEQEQIGIAWPGVSATDAEFATQQVILGILAGGMSGRLFTEVREKQGLVYWVSAWHETPRGAGMLFMGASTTPERCDRTYRTMLREVDRLAEDIQPDELERAVTGILAQRETRGDMTRARCAELADDLFQHGRAVPEEEKTAKVRAVTIEAIGAFLEAHPRDRLCVVTLGPKALNDGQAREPAVAADAVA